MKTPPAPGSPARTPSSAKPAGAAKKGVRSQYAKAAAMGLFIGAIASARMVDLALIASGIAAAVGSVAFAGLMVMEGDHTPWINGMQYLAIFAQPGAAPHSPETPAAAELAAAPAPAPASVDMAPVGSIGPRTPTQRPDFELVSAGRDHAMVRAGMRMFVVRPGDDVPDLGKVRSIDWSDGRWSLLSASGAALLTSGETARPKPPSFERKKMIFTDGR
ncbi:MAG: hypothetical protein ACLPN5_13165 [Roseiarcus sp.]